MNFYIQRLISLKKIATAILSIQIIGTILSFIIIGLVTGGVVNFPNNLFDLSGTFIVTAIFGILFILILVILGLTTLILMIVFTSKAGSLRFMGPKDMMTRSNIQYLYSNSLAATILTFIIGIGGLYWFIFSFIAISKLSTLISQAYMPKSNPDEPNESYDNYNHYY